MGEYDCMYTNRCTLSYTQFYNSFNVIALTQVQDVSICMLVHTNVGVSHYGYSLISLLYLRFFYRTREENENRALIYR